MSDRVLVDVDGATIEAFRGDRLLDAALLGGMELPHGCRAGNCGTCRVEVLAGSVVVDGEARTEGVVCACQAIVASDVKVRPALVRPARVLGIAQGITDLTPAVVELTVAVAQPFAWRAGQHVAVTFEGLPARPLCPTVALDGSDRPGTIRFHIDRRAGGRLSGGLGDVIRPGHRLLLDGPYGTAHFVPGCRRRLVLFSEGAGFAPMWAIADQALREDASRAMLVVAGADALENLYMAEALERMWRCPNVVIQPMTMAPQSLTRLIAAGSPLAKAGLIVPGDRIYAAGPRGMVAALAARAQAVGAFIHATPFAASAPDDERWLADVARRFAHDRTQRSAGPRGLRPPVAAAASVAYRAQPIPR